MDQDNDLKDGRPDLSFEAWGIIANAFRFIDDSENPEHLEWKAAAIRWRDRFHDSLELQIQEDDYASVAYVKSGEKVDTAAPAPLDDPWFKTRCLELAIANSTPGVNNPSVLTKAREFEQYLKGENK